MTLDDPIQTQEPVSIWGTVVRFGVIGGLIFIVIGLISYLTGLASSTGGTGSTLSFIVSLAIIVGLIVWAVRSHREELNGYIKYGQAFLVGWLVIILAGLIGSLFNYVYLSFIDTEFIENLKDNMQMEYERNNMSEEQIEMAMGFFSPEFLTLAGFGSQIFIGLVCAAIVAAVMKRNPE